MPSPDYNDFKQFLERVLGGEYYYNLPPEQFDSDFTDMFKGTAASSPPATTSSRTSSSTAASSSTTA